MDTLIVTGDCLTFLPTLPPASVELAFSDPSFNIGLDHPGHDDKPIHMTKSAPSRSRARITPDARRPRDGQTGPAALPIASRTQAASAGARAG
jgi:hypothetical protein